MSVLLPTSSNSLSILADDFAVGKLRLFTSAALQFLHIFANTCYTITLKAFLFAIFIKTT